MEEVQDGGLGPCVLFRAFGGGASLAASSGSLAHLRRNTNVRIEKEAPPWCFLLFFCSPSAHTRFLRGPVGPAAVARERTLTQRSSPTVHP